MEFGKLQSVDRVDFTLPASAPRRGPAEPAPHPEVLLGAARYLSAAVQIDPGGYERYLKQLRTFDTDTKLLKPASMPKRKSQPNSDRAKPK